MVKIIIIVVIGAGIIAAIRLSRRQKDEFDELIVTPTVQAAGCGSDLPRVRRFFDQTVMTIGEAESALKAQANRELERLAREVQVRPDEARSDRLLGETSSALSTWVGIAEGMDDADMEDLEARGVELFRVLQWKNRRVDGKAELDELIVLLRAVHEALRSRGWGAVPRQ